MFKTVFSTVYFICIACMTSAVLSQPYEVSEEPDTSIFFSELSVEQYSLHYAWSGDVEKPGIVFIHGTPGGWQAFASYLELEQLQQDFLLVSVDRLGWGKSDMSRAKVDGDFDLQAKSIVAVFDRYPAKKWIIVGHSLGASIGPKIALMAPERVAGLLLLAGSLDPKLGKPRWFNRAASTWLISKMMPVNLRKSNDEIMALSTQLKIMSKQIKKVRLPTRLVVMQGNNDNLVSPKNPRFVEKYWQDNFADVKLIELPEAGHFLPWQQAPLVIDNIRALADQTFSPD